MNRKSQLERLETALAELVAILECDPQCQWCYHFESSLAQTREFLSSGFSQSQLNEFSVSVMHVYGGMGSFNDYAPIIYDQASGKYIEIPGTEDLEQAASHVYRCALSLRVVDEEL